jgi:4-hydroxybenzoate polyprenyltransferase
VKDRSSKLLSRKLWNLIIACWSLWGVAAGGLSFTAIALMPDTAMRRDIVAWFMPIGSVCLIIVINRIVRARMVEDARPAGKRTKPARNHDRIAQILYFLAGLTLLGMIAANVFLYWQGHPKELGPAAAATPQAAAQLVLTGCVAGLIWGVIMGALCGLAWQHILRTQKQ